MADAFVQALWPDMVYYGTDPKQSGLPNLLSGNLICKFLDTHMQATGFGILAGANIPIALSVLFCKTEWKPVEHRVSAASLRQRRSKQEALPF